MRSMLDMYQSTFRAMTPSMNPFEFIAPPSPAASEKTRARDVEIVAGETPAKMDSTEVQDLKLRVEELESLVSKVARQRPARRTKAKPRKSR
jgi:hypothetical protein